MCAGGRFGVVGWADWAEKGVELLPPMDTPYPEIQQRSHQTKSSRQQLKGDQTRSGCTVLGGGGPKAETRITTGGRYGQLILSRQIAGGFSSFIVDSTKCVVKAATLLSP